MRVRIRHGKLRIGIRLPAGWLLNRFTAGIAARAMNESRVGEVVTAEQVSEFFRRVKSVREEFRGLTIVEAVSASGDRVHITL